MRRIPAAVGTAAEETDTNNVGLEAQLLRRELEEALSDPFGFDVPSLDGNLGIQDWCLRSELGRRELLWICERSEKGI